MSTTLDQNVKKAVRQGWRVESRNDSQAVLVRGHTPNHVLHLLLSIVTLGVWIPVWILIGVTTREKRRVVSA